MKYYIAFIILLIIYIYSYYNYPKKTKIIQTRMDGFNYNMLAYRQPVIIDTATVDIDSLPKKWFYLNLVKKFNITATNEEIWYDNKYKYTVLQPQDSGEIILYPASKKMNEGNPDPAETLLAINISKGQLIILPFHWKYLVKIDVKCLGVDDIISYLTGNL